MQVQEVNVFITEPDKSGDPPKLRLDQPIFGIHSGDNVLWHFHSVVKKVRWVELEFARAKFFESRGSSDPSPSCYTDLKNGHGHLLGTAPQLGAPKSKKEKYSIRGYGSKPDPVKPKPKPEPVFVEDPDVIICDP